MNSNNKTLVLRYFLWTAVLALMLVIFFHSAQNAEQSSATSGSFAKTVLTLVVKGFSSLPEADQQAYVSGLQFIVRKGAHFAVYFMLGLLCFYAMNTYSVKLKTKFLMSLAISFAYAVSDEIHQLFVPGRAGQLRDVFIDFSGAVTGVFVAWLIPVIIRKLKQRRIPCEQEKAN